MDAVKNFDKKAGLNTGNDRSGLNTGTLPSPKQKTINLSVRFRDNSFNRKSSIASERLLPDLMNQTNPYSNNYL